MTSYKDSGVNIDAGNEAVKGMKKYLESTYNKNVISDMGGFSGMFEFKGYKNPVLVSSIDGVGTKLKIAFELNKHDTVGQDLVNHSVNDILVHGAKPLFFLDYFGVGKLEPNVAVEIVKGFSKACKENECVLIGGETAELPGIYQEGEYDLAGSIVGVVEKNKIIDGKDVKHGDKVIGFASSGLHSNGYSLARKILLDKFKLTDHVDELGCTLGEELLKIHISYLSEVIRNLNKIKGMAHITGGGFDNICRVLKNVDVKINRTWEVPSVFRLIQKLGKVDTEEMFRTFNMGIGFVVIVDKDSEINDGIEIGEVVEGSGKVVIT